MAVRVMKNYALKRYFSANAFCTLFQQINNAFLWLPKTFGITWRDSNPGPLFLRRWRCRLCHAAWAKTTYPQLQCHSHAIADMTKRALQTREWNLYLWTLPTYTTRYSVPFEPLFRQKNVFQLPQLQPDTSSIRPLLKPAACWHDRLKQTRVARWYIFKQKCQFG
jgi:hypothetical protein